MIDWREISRSATQGLMNRSVRYEQWHVNNGGSDSTDVVPLPARHSYNNTHHTKKRQKSASKLHIKRNLRVN